MPQSNQKQKSTALVVYTPRKANQKRKTLAALPPYVQLAVDPFTAPAQGAGRPDDNSDPTVPWPEAWSQTFTTDAQGNLLVALRGSLVNGVYVNTLSAVADPAVTGQNNGTPASFATLASTFTHYRPLTLAVEAYYIGESQLCKGVIGVAKVNGAPVAGETFSQYTDELAYRECPAEEKVAAKIVFNEANFVTTATAYSNGCILLICSGLPASSACIRLRGRLTFEFQISHTALMSRDAVHTISHPPQIAVAASIVGPKAQVAAGKDPVTDLVRYSEKLAIAAGAVNGLWQSAKPLASLMADFAVLL